MVEETGRIKSYFLAHSQAGFQIDLVLLRLLLLELGERAGGDDVAIFGLVFARPVVLAPLGGDAGWDPVRRLRTALPSRLGSEVIVLDGGLLVALFSVLAEGVEGFTVHGGEVRHVGGGECLYFMLATALWRDRTVGGE